MDSAVDLIGDVSTTDVLIQPVILSGGAGTRLWPLSRDALPKQFLPLTSDRSLLQETALRTARDPAFADPAIVCNAAHRAVVVDQMKTAGVRPRLVIVEPIGRGTAPALAATALMLIATDPDAVMLVQPSDHRIFDDVAFRATARRGLEAAVQGRLVTFGVTPPRAETGYGYIRRADAAAEKNGVYTIRQFIERPDAEHAQYLTAQKNCLWNSGIFLFSARRYLEEIEALEPKMFFVCAEAVAHAVHEDGAVILDGQHFSQAPDLSIDRAVMERSASAAVVPLELSREELGSWRALRESGHADSDGNVAHTGEPVERMCEDARWESVRKDTVRRPWGHFTTVDGGPRHQVKQIVVKPGERLSLQLHHHRSEHWVVVSGTARVICGSSDLLLRENESIHIPAGSEHRLENPGKIPLRVIEVQCGSYLGEDDIVRVDDVYGRA